MLIRGKRVWFGLLFLCIGVGWHMAALAIAERTVGSYPPIDDIVLRVLPRIDLFGIGEAIFFAYLILFAVLFFRQQDRDLGRLLTTLGLFYALRGFFLLLLPIGPPLDAFVADDRLTIYPYASHAYFPGGHIGIMLVMAWAIRHRQLRIGLTIFSLVFGFGSLLTRAHYTADLLGGVLLAYSVCSLMKQWFEKKKISSEHG